MGDREKHLTAIGGDPYVDLLLKKVEQRFGSTVNSPTAFLALSDDMESITGQLLSVSTLKRLWGYVGNRHEARESTLDILAQYIGFKSFADFAKTEKDNNDIQSTIGNGRSTVVAEEIPAEVCVELRWMPDRRVLLRHISGSEFIVVANENSSLYTGAKLHITYLSQGEALHATVAQADGIFRPYTAGINNGIRFRFVSAKEPKEGR